MSKELKRARSIKYLWETSANSDSETTVIKLLHQGDLEIEFLDFNSS